jgi:hypothetical protein
LLSPCGICRKFSQNIMQTKLLRSDVGYERSLTCSILMKEWKIWKKFSQELPEFHLEECCRVSRELLSGFAFCAAIKSLARHNELWLCGLRFKRVFLCLKFKLRGVPRDDDYKTQRQARQALRIRFGAVLFWLGRSLWVMWREVLIDFGKFEVQWALKKFHDVSSIAWHSPRIHPT